MKRNLAAATLPFLLAIAAPATAMTIDLTYDPSVSAATEFAHCPAGDVRLVR